MIKEVLDLADRIVTKQEVVEKIVNIAQKEEGIWLRVQWDGLPEKRDSTWARLEYMQENVPEILSSYMK